MFYKQKHFCQCGQGLKLFLNKAVSSEDSVFPCKANYTNYLLIGVEDHPESTLNPKQERPERRPWLSWGVEQATVSLWSTAAKICATVKLENVEI